ncbi:MAG: hypothetical protein OXD40_01975 [bacterium]|nr:hypothetical protein [bacterium]
MTERQGTTPRRYEAVERRPGETLEDHLKRRAARMRRVQAELAACEELDLDEMYGPLLDEEEQLWLGPNDERIEHGRIAREDVSLAIIRTQNAIEDARLAGHLDEIRRLETEERRLWERYEKVYRPDPQAVTAMRELDDPGEVRHRTIRQELQRTQADIAAAREAGQLGEVRRLESEERWRLDLLERIRMEAAAAKRDLQDLVRHRGDRARAVAGR